MSEAQYANGSVMSVDASNESSKNSSGRSSGKSSSTDSADGEEQEDASSSSSLSQSFHNQAKDVEDELSSFREKWQKELKIHQDKNVKKKEQDYEMDEKEGAEEQARKWFLEGVECEQKGKLYEAIQYYKKAVQLVPDIEFRLYSEPTRTKPKNRTQSENSIGAGDENICEEESEDDEEEDDLDLMTKLHRVMAKTRSICLPQNEQKSTHISDLPTEIILYILRWVVSYDLDLRSLEMCSMVSRGFYLCCRDSEIWKMACLRVWGVNCGGLTNYDSWREMFLQRPRLNFNGCYISKTTYIRHGENSFQDQFYRPWHVVEYYRYLRFFPEGTVLMLTTPDQPVPVLSLLKRKDVRNSSVLVGHYRLSDDKVTLALRRQEFLNNNKYRGKRNNMGNMELIEQSFHIELQVMSWKHRLNSQLQWKLYCVNNKRGNAETSTNFEVASNKFPPFWFSRVKSYTAEADRPLM